MFHTEDQCFRHFISPYILLLGAATPLATPSAKLERPLTQAKSFIAAVMFLFYCPPVPLMLRNV
jgi:hypothetical protein